MVRRLSYALPLFALFPLGAAAQDRPLAEACPTLPAQVRGEIERAERDRAGEPTWYARAYCVSLAEARRRAETQNRDAVGPETEPGGPPPPPRDSIGVISQRVETGEPTFAGLWIQHQPDYRVVVAFTRDAAATLRKYTTDPLFKPLDRPGPTYKELRATQDSLYRELERLGARPVSAGADVMQARVEVEVVGDMGQFRAAVARGEVSLPPYVTIREPKPIATPTPPRAAGGPVKAFPRSRYRSGGPQLAILRTGKLVLEDGCLRLDEERHKRVIVWQHEAALDVQADRLRVLDRDSRISIAPGERIVLGGNSGPVTDETLVMDADPACPGPYYLVAGFSRIEPLEESQLQNRAGELRQSAGLSAAAALAMAHEERAREQRLSALGEALLERAPESYAGHWTYRGRATFRFAGDPQAEARRLVPSDLLAFVTAETAPRPLAALRADKNTLLDQLDMIGLAATAHETPETGEISLEVKDLPALSRAAVAGRVRFPASTHIVTDGATSIGGYSDATLQAANRALEAAPDFAALRTLVAATPVPSRQVTGADGPDQPMSRATSLDTTRFLIAHGFTAHQVVELRRRGVDPVRAFLDQNGGATAANRAILAREVVVGELIGVDDALIGDGFRSTAKFRIVEPLKGSLGSGEEIAVRMVSGRDPDDSFRQSNDEPMLLPGLPGSLTRGSRWVLYLSDSMLAHQARLSGGKAPPFRAFIPTHGLWQVDGERIAGRPGEPMPATLAELRAALAPIDRAHDAATSRRPR